MLALTLMVRASGEVLLVWVGLVGHAAVLLAAWVAWLGSSLLVLLSTPPRESVLHPKLQGTAATWDAFFS